MILSQFLPAWVVLPSSVCLSRTVRLLEARGCLFWLSHLAQNHNVMSEYIEVEKWQRMLFSSQCIFLWHLLYSNPGYLGCSLTHSDNWGFSFIKVDRSKSLLCGGGEIVRAGLWGRGEVRRPIRGSLQTDGVVLHQSGSNRDGERSS